MTDQRELSQLIESLGFTSLEAEIYVYLLQHSPATGYKVAKGIGRSFTNTYKAIAALQGKGAILVEEEKSRLSRAVPIEELMDQMETRFKEKRRRAVEAANSIPSSPQDTRMYHLTSVDQVYERCRKMLDMCAERALLELFPEPFVALSGAVDAAASRGLKVAVRVYNGETLEGVQVIQSPYGQLNSDMWRSQWMAVFIDGRQFMLAHLANGGEGVYEAVWSANPFIARAFYSYVNSDLHHYSFLSALDSSASVESIRNEYNRTQELFPVGGDLGFTDLVELFHSKKDNKPVNKENP